MKGHMEMVNDRLIQIELAIDVLLSTPRGRPIPQETQRVLTHLAGLPPGADRTEQLRLALRLLECHDQAPRRVRKREPEAGA